MGISVIFFSFLRHKKKCDGRVKINEKIITKLRVSNKGYTSFSVFSTRKKQQLKLKAKLKFQI